MLKIKIKLPDGTVIEPANMVLVTIDDGNPRGTATVTLETLVKDAQFNTRTAF